MVQNLEPLLALHPFFSGLRSDHLTLLVGCASNRRYDPGELVFRQGDEARDFFLIRHGKVAIDVSAPDKGAITLQTLREGDVIGWSWIVPPYVNRFDARAVELTRAVALDGACLRGKFDEDHELAYELLRRFVGVIAERLESARIQLLDLYGHKAYGR